MAQGMDWPAFAPHERPRPQAGAENQSKLIEFREGKFKLVEVASG
jgi:hypothetical protein